MTTLTSPTVDDTAIASMLQRAGAQAGLNFTDKAIGIVARIASGMPDQARHIGLRITQATVQRGDDLVMDQDILEALEHLLREADPAIVEAYADVTTAGTDAAARAALQSVAGAAQDVWGGMSLVHSGEAATVGGQAVPAAILTRFLQAGILAPMPGAAPGVVHFHDAAMPAYVHLLAARDALRAEQDAAAPKRLRR
jgi:hypothetical protein